MINMFFTKPLSMLSSQFVMITDAGKKSSRTLMVRWVNRNKKTVIAKKKLKII